MTLDPTPAKDSCSVLVKELRHRKAVVNNAQHFEEAWFFEQCARVLETVDVQVSATPAKDESEAAAQDRELDLHDHCIIAASRLVMFPKTDIRDITATIEDQMTKCIAAATQGMTDRVKSLENLYDGANKAGVQFHSQWKAVEAANATLAQRVEELKHDSEGYHATCKRLWMALGADAVVGELPVDVQMVNKLTVLRTRLLELEKERAQIVPLFEHQKETLDETRTRLLALEGQNAGLVKNNGRDEPEGL